MAIDRIQNFLTQLAATPPEMVETVCDAYVASLTQDFSPAYAKKVLSQTRKEVSDPIALNRLKLSLEMQKALKSAYTKSVVARNASIKDFSVEQFIQVGEELLTSQSYVGRCLGLAALTGRRPFEICVSGSLRFFNPKIHSPNYATLTNAGEVFDINELADSTVHFQGQAKTREKNESKDGYVIPVLSSSERIIESFEGLRAGWDMSELDSETFHSRASKQLAAASRKFFGTIVPEVNAKALRKCYASSCEFLEYRPGNVSINLYFARILGHSHLDLSTASTYQDYKGV